MKSFTILTLTLCALFFAACSEPFVHDEPKAEDLYGRYILTEVTMERLKGMGYESTNSYVDLKSDGSFVLHTIPDCWLDRWGKSHGGFDSGRGKWKIKKSYSVYNVYFSVEEFTKESTVYTNEGTTGGFGCPMTITKRNGNYGLAADLMAGDSGYLYFSKGSNR